MTESDSENLGQQPPLADLPPLSGTAAATAAGTTAAGTTVDTAGRPLGKLLGIAAILGVSVGLFWWNLSRRNELEQQAKEAIAGLGGLVVSDVSQTHVESLNLQLIKDEAAIQEAMQWVDKLPYLKILDLSKTAIGDDDLATISRLGQLNSLHLNETKITDAAIGHITPLTQLQGLHLGGTGVTDEAIPQIVKLPNLIHLDLSQTAVGPGVAQLAQIDKLKWLLLRGIPLDPPLVAALEKLIKLKRLTVGKELGESEPTKALQAKMPQLTIDW